MSRSQTYVALLALSALAAFLLWRPAAMVVPAGAQPDGASKTRASPGKADLADSSSARQIMGQSARATGSRLPAAGPASDYGGAPTLAGKVRSLETLTTGFHPFTYPALPVTPPSPELAFVETGEIEEAPEQLNVSATSKSECGALTPSGACVKRLAHDADGDGYSKDRDCDDLLGEVHPGARELPCNHLDDDCDGIDFCPKDRDGDHSYADQDCDDRDPRRHPLAQEIFCNGIDEDCSGFDVCDRDHDGDPAPHDCNDRSAASHHGARELACDGIDQDCSGSDCCGEDADGDGHPCRSDCDDGRADSYPGAPTPTGCYTRDLDCDGRLDGTDCA